MSDIYSGLTDGQVMELSQAMLHHERPQRLHDYVRTVRDLCDGANIVAIPQSHRTLNIGANHAGGLRLNERIKQGAAWLSSARVQFSVTPGSADYRDSAERMEKFARFGEQRLSRGRGLHNWKREAARDLFECGVSIVQQNATSGFYVKASSDRTLMDKGARIEEIIWTRRVDPQYAWWAEDTDGGLGAFQVVGQHRTSDLMRMAGADRRALVRKSFAWAESLPDSGYMPEGESLEVREIWLCDYGYLIVTGDAKEGRGSRMAADDPRRIISKWRNSNYAPPFYITTATPWPWTSPLDEMVALTPERDYWETMHDYQAAGAIFRHWQLKDTNTGEDLARAIWNQPVPEHVLLDLSKPPPFMGAGTEWVLAPFEFFDVTARLGMIIQQHESAGASVARLMGSVVNQNTAVGTADMIEDYARREFSQVIEASEHTAARRWEDSFRYIAEYHKREPVMVAARKRDPGTMQFFQTNLELNGSDIVAEDVTATLDTRSRVALIADWKFGREMRTSGDMSFDRAVEMGLVPYVDDAQEEKADIYLDQLDAITAETEIAAHQQTVAQSLGLGQQPQATPAPSNITRGARTDPRGTGVGPGALNMGDTALAPGASDTARSA